MLPRTISNMFDYMLLNPKNPIIYLVGFFFVINRYDNTSKIIFD